MRISDWSSDVCSSDLVVLIRPPCRVREDRKTSTSWPGEGSNRPGPAARAEKEPGCRQPGSGQQGACRSEFNRRRCLESARQSLDQIAAKRRGPIGFVRDIIDVEAEGDRRLTRGHDIARAQIEARPFGQRSEEHTSELQSLMRISYAVFCLKK